MKIVYLHQYFTSPEMAGGTRSYEMAKRLVAWGHEVHIVTSFRDKTEHKEWFSTEDQGIHIHWLPVAYSNHMSYSDRIKAFFKFAFYSARKAASIQADVIFATSTPLTIALPGVYAARQQGKPMVFEVRDLWPELPIAMGALKNPVLVFLAHLLERFAYRNSKRIVALSPGMADGVVQCGFDRDKVAVIPNSADLELFKYDEVRAAAFRSKHPELGDGPIVLYAGTLGYINGVPYLPRLAAEVLKQNSDIRFVVIGDGVERELVEKTARELNVLGRNFFMYGKMPKRELVDAFSAASLVTSLFLDIKEMQANSANKFFDGLASGTPVAINYGGWQAEILIETGAGIVLSPVPIEAAPQVVEFLSDVSKVQIAAEKALLLAKDRFDREILARKLEGVLRQAIDSV